MNLSMAIGQANLLQLARVVPSVHLDPVFHHPDLNLLVLKKGWLVARIMAKTALDPLPSLVLIALGHRLTTLCTCVKWKLV
jgi:hypothetical protein